MFRKMKLVPFDDQSGGAFRNFAVEDVDKTNLSILDKKMLSLLRDKNLPEDVRNQMYSQALTTFNDLLLDYRQRSAKKLHTRDIKSNTSDESIPNTPKGKQTVKKAPKHNQKTPVDKEVVMKTSPDRSIDEFDYMSADDDTLNQNIDMDISNSQENAEEEDTYGAFVLELLNQPVVFKQFKPILQMRTMEAIARYIDGDPNQKKPDRYEEVMQVLYKNDPDIIGKIYTPPEATISQRLTRNRVDFPRQTYSE